MRVGGKGPHNSFPAVMHFMHMTEMDRDQAVAEKRVSVGALRRPKETGHRRKDPRGGAQKKTLAHKRRDI